MLERTVLLLHPILFVMDFGNEDVAVPKYSPESLISSSESCVAVKAIADVDGEVTVRLLGVRDAMPPEPSKVAFDGVVATPSQKLAVVTAQNEKLLEIDVPGKGTAVIVYVDDEAFPSKVLVKVR